MKQTKNHVIITSILFIILGLSCTEPKYASKNSSSKEATFNKIAFLVPLGNLENLENVKKTIFNEYNLKEDNDSFTLATFQKENPTRKEVIETLTKIATDQTLKGMIVYKAFPGTSDAFLATKKIRPDFLCVAVEPIEDYLQLEASADLVISESQSITSWMVIKEAKRQKTNTLIFIENPLQKTSAHYEALLEAIKKEAKSSNISVIIDQGHDKTRKQKTSYEIINEKLSEWSKNGIPAIFTTDTFFSEVLFSLAEQKKIVLLTSSANNFDTYRKLNNIVSTLEKPDFTIFREQIEKYLISNKKSIDFSSNIFPSDFVLMISSFNFLQSVINNSTKIDDIVTFKTLLSQKIHGAKFELEYFLDPNTKVRSKNHFFFVEDYYILNKGYAGFLKDPIPQNVVVGK